MKSKAGAAILKFAADQFIEEGADLLEATAEDIAGKIYELLDLNLEIMKSQDSCKLYVRVFAKHQFNIPFLVNTPSTENIAFEGFVSAGAPGITQACGLIIK